MGSFSVWHWLIVLVIVVLVFGTKKLKNLGSDLGGAVKGFKDGVKVTARKRRRRPGSRGPAAGLDGTPSARPAIPSTSKPRPRFEGARFAGST